jgi:uncharacterized SAM-binding protein YcdF (DUF218 family)
MRRRRRRLLRWITLGIVPALLLGWAAGFVWFIRLADRAEPPPPHADGIVALTGGANRVETALHLLAEGRAEWLLVSGIGPGPDLASLAKRSLVDAAPLTARIELGRQATSTRGNAAETAAWVRAKDIHSVIVVTAWYHMPRALTELARAVPGVVLYPAPVEPEGSHPPDHVMTGAMPWATAWAMARLLAEEYSKYLAARLDLTALVPERPPTPVRSVHPG